MKKLLLCFAIIYLSLPLSGQLYKFPQPGMKQGEYYKYINVSGTKYSDYITAVRKDELVSIAVQCPITGGQGVFDARVLLSFVNNSVVDFDDNCPGQSGAKLAENNVPLTPHSITATNSRKIKLYPNPNDGNMILEYHLEEGEKGGLLLFDLTGRLWRKYDAVNANNTLIIKENELPNGIYFYELRINGNLVSKEKVIVIK